MTPPPGKELTTEQTFFSVRFVGELGTSFEGTPIRGKLANGSTVEAVLDGHSGWRMDGIEGSGPVSVEFPEGLVPNPKSPGVEGFQAETSLPRMGAFGNAFSGQTGVEHTVVVERPGTTCVRMSGMLFPLNKTFLLPAAMEGIRLLAHMYKKLPGAELLAVGHTDTTGNANRNRSLSLQRAEAMIQFITDDVDGWLGYYSKGTDFSRRWGPEEDLAMLSALPPGDLPHYHEDHVEHTLEAATKRLQEARRLPATGELDRTTREALITEYMAIDGTSLPSGVQAQAHGCGQSFLAVETENDVEELANRRVEVFMFPDGVEPAPVSALSNADSPEYPAWLESIVQERTFRPSATGLGSMEIVTDIEESYQAQSGVAYMLRSTDGAYERELTPIDGSVVRGYTVLEFTEMPLGSFYSLFVRYASGHEAPLFKDVPFRELSGVGNRGVDEILDPITLEPVDR